MSSRERWSEVDAILDAALGRPAGERAAFVAEACGADTALRRSVERLLELARSGEDLRTGGGLPESLLDAMPRGGEAETSEVYATGSRIEHYEVLGPIGAGGMGQVYRARDLELRREVALKVLPNELAADDSFMQRFRREARVLATLNHPNIAALFELLEKDGRPHLILELVEGETLQGRLARGPLAAEGVAEAHRKGIVHRDLKPGNVGLTREGRVKVLDFGLAKAAPEARDGSFTTQTGALLGTAPYMSPEQVRGEAVDRRTDVWAFGCVLYEMLTGRRAFDGRSVSDILASVLRDDVDWGRVPPATPRDLRRLLERCLRKDPRRRLQDLADAALELAEMPGRGAARAGPQRPVPLALRGRGRDRRRRRHGSPGDPLVAAPRVSRSGPQRDPSPSRAVVPAERRGVGGALARWEPAGLRRRGRGGAPPRPPLASLQTTPLPETEGGRGPFFSPDGGWIGFAAGGELRKRPLAGGTSVSICEVDVFRGGSWGEGDVIVFGGRSGLRRVSASGGTPEPITRLDPAEGIEHLDPTLLPGGEAVVFTIWHGAIDTARLAVHSLRTGEQRDLVPGASARTSPLHVRLHGDGLGGVAGAQVEAPPGPGWPRAALAALEGRERAFRLR